MLHILDLTSNNFSGEVSVEFFQSLKGIRVIDGNKGNPRLCGVPLVNKCNQVGSQMLLPKEGEDSWIDGLSI
ncbi:hypothetical protein Golob_023795 [Gossypium lobatum]|uniref:Uncharacterized protein n=1 Tax=Gossypium lobatum TaxID=34289 RepID=A0A7J8NIP0_9ROSI|nr:hypothetical protein [Gossypium lobatum]